MCTMLRPSRLLDYYIDSSKDDDQILSKHTTMTKLYINVVISRISCGNLLALQATH